jgi:hypothetical protein
METLTRLVSESLARHGFDRPLDYRRLQWSCWFRCESHHSLLSVPSKPGVFALAEEVVDFGITTSRGATEARAVQRSGAGASVPEAESRKPEAETETEIRRVLAVSQFFEDDDMAFVLDRMVSYQNPLRSRLSSGRYFVRYVVIEDPSQRRSICAALNQWLISSAEKVTGIGAHFATSLELTEHNLTAKPASADTINTHVETGAKLALSPAKAPVAQKRSEAVRGTTQSLAQNRPATAPQLDSGAAANIHCPSPFPSGF